jgi:hypothetical protein
LDAFFKFLSDNFFWFVVLLIVGGGSVLGLIRALHAETQKRKIAVAEAQVRIAEAKRDEIRAQAEVNKAAAEIARLQVGQPNSSQPLLESRRSGPLSQN